MPEETACRDRVVRQPARRAAAAAVCQTRSAQVRVGRQPTHRPTARHRPVDGRGRPAATGRARHRDRPGCGERTAGVRGRKKRHRKSSPASKPQIGLQRVGREVLDAPDSKQIAASIVETAGEIDALYLGKGPGQLVENAGSMQQRSDVSFEPVMPEGVQKFSLYPSGTYGVGGENEDEPIAALQRSADLIVPLLGTLNVSVAVPHWNLMAVQNADQSLSKRLIFVRMRDKNFGRHVCGPLAQAWLRSASAIGLTSGSPLSGFGSTTQRNFRTIQGISLSGSCSRRPTTTGISR